MTEPTRIDKFKKAKRKSRARGKTLCARGLHKWVFDPKKQFDVDKGRLVSIKRCARCGATKSQIG